MVVLHLRARLDLEAHAQKDLLELVQHLLKRVPTALHRAPARQGDVDALGGEALLQQPGRQFFAPLADLGVDGGPHLVGKGAYLWALLCGEAAHLLEDRGHLALFAEEPHPQFFQRGFAVRLGEQFFRALADFFQCFSHLRTHLK